MHFFQENQGGHCRLVRILSWLRSIKNALRLALSLAMAEAVERRGGGGVSGEGETLVLRHAPLIETVEMCVQFAKDMNR